MPNIATALRHEVTRLARKELRTQLDPLKKSVASLRSEVAVLKRRNQALEAALRQAARARPRAAVPEADEADGKPARFSAKGLATNRRRLGLSAHNFGLLLGVSGQSIYAWEQGRAKPRAKQLTAIAALRGIGKKEAANRLAAPENGA
jgi:DNA-binding transcriptional regulator YiaG